MLGAQALKRVIIDKDALGYFNAKLGPTQFKGEDELTLFQYVDKHYKEYHVLPALETVEKKFPDLGQIHVPEPSLYYLTQLDKRFGYDLIKRTDAACHELLKANAQAVDEAWAMRAEAYGEWLRTKNRVKIMDVGVEGPQFLLKTYFEKITHTSEEAAFFGWPYMDDMGGVDPGEMVSIVGRPAMGKTYQMLFCAIENWAKRHQNVLFVSPEMMIKPIMQRVGAMYTHCPVSQLKVAGFSTQTFEYFETGLEKMEQEPAKFYVVDVNLAASVDEIYALAAILKCRIVFIDGAYMLNHPNKRLRNVIERVAENVPIIKQQTTTHKFITFCSWQFNRDAAKKMDKKKGSKPGTEDIGYSDTIGQFSSIVIAIMQEEGVETIIKRDLDLLKGRGGEVGRFPIHWDFDSMNFRQYGITAEDQQEASKDSLSFV